MNKSKCTTTIPQNFMPAKHALEAVKKQGKVQPFGAYLATKLQTVHSKLICALSTPGAGGDGNPYP